MTPSARTSMNTQHAIPTHFPMSVPSFKHFASADSSLLMLMAHLLPLEHRLLEGMHLILCAAEFPGAA
jgi:hypothetical protein